MRRDRALWLWLVLALIIICSRHTQPLIAEQCRLASFSPEVLFDVMEKRTERIDAMSAKVELQDAVAGKSVTLSVKSPDKFAISFADGSIEVRFNGQNLWIHVLAINEVFYHFAENQNFFSSCFSWFSPKKMFTNLTRKTLFSLFTIEPVTSQKQSDSEILYTLRFTPKLKSVFKSVFDVGYYHMVFSSKTYLPVRVVEFSPTGLERGRLVVLEYQLNEKISDSFFDFVAPEGAVMVPLNVVLAQKLEECALVVVDKIKETAESIRKSIIDWSF